MNSQRDNVPVKQYGWFAILALLLLFGVLLVHYAGQPLATVERVSHEPARSGLRLTPSSATSTSQSVIDDSSELLAQHAKPSTQPQHEEQVAQKAAPIPEQVHPNEDDGYRKIEGIDGKIYRVGKNERLIFDNGKPIIVPKGMVYESRTYSLTRDGVKIEIDEEFGEWMQQEIHRLWREIDDARNEETRIYYQAELDALYAEYGNLSTSVTRMGRGTPP